MKRYLLLALLLFTLTGKVNAATLFGRVIEINDGDVITVFNLKRPVRIRLLAVDAPEAGQDFGAAAKKHLSDLVHDKSVLVEYWGIAADGSLVGRVTLGGTDIGAQMIRDGAAWFDANNQSRLSATDREIYRQSEQAARSERRGLWEAENPVAPWEFVRAANVRHNPAGPTDSTLSLRARPARPTSELTSLMLIAGRMSPASPAGNEDAGRKWTVPNSTGRAWRQFKPEGENFSALVPEDGLEMKKPVPFGDRMVDVNVYMVRDGWAVYSLMWITGPSYGETDQAAINGSVLGFLMGVGEGYKSSGGTDYSCRREGERKISAGGYTGIEFDLAHCTIPAKIRAFTKVSDGERQMYVGAVLFTEEDENVGRFLKSFNIATPKKSRGTTNARP